MLIDLVNVPGYTHTRFTIGGFKAAETTEFGTHTSNTQTEIRDKKSRNKRQQEEQNWSTQATHGQK